MRLICSTADATSSGPGTPAHAATCAIAPCHATKSTTSAAQRASIGDHLLSTLPLLLGSLPQEAVSLVMQSYALLQRECGGAAATDASRPS